MEDTAATRRENAVESDVYGRGTVVQVSHPNPAKKFRREHKIFLLCVAAACLVLIGGITFQGPLASLAQRLAPSVSSWWTDPSLGLLSLWRAARDGVSRWVASASRRTATTQVAVVNAQHRTRVVDGLTHKSGPSGYKWLPGSDAPMPLRPLDKDVPPVPGKSDAESLDQGANRSMQSDQRGTDRGFDNLLAGRDRESLSRMAPFIALRGRPRAARTGSGQPRGFRGARLSANRIQVGFEKSRFEEMSTAYRPAAPPDLKGKEIDPKIELKRPGSLQQAAEEVLEKLGKSALKKQEGTAQAGSSISNAPTASKLPAQAASAAAPSTGVQSVLTPSTTSRGEQRQANTLPDPKAGGAWDDIMKLYGFERPDKNPGTGEFSFLGRRYSLELTPDQIANPAAHFQEIINRISDAADVPAFNLKYEDIRKYGGVEKIKSLFGASGEHPEIMQQIANDKGAMAPRDLKISIREAGTGSDAPAATIEIRKRNCEMKITAECREKGNCVCEPTGD